MSTVERRDNDFHKYLLPESLADEFDRLLEIAQNAPFMSSDRWNAEDALVEKFSRYLIGSAPR